MKKAFILCVATLFFSISLVNAQSYYGSSYSYGSSSTNSYGTGSSYSTGTTNSSVRYQSGYTRTDGTYVQGHYKTTSNSTNHDNYSTSGNSNPYTGTSGTRARARDYSSSAYNYGSGHAIYTGPKGGQYYYNSNGNKTYVPKR